MGCLRLEKCCCVFDLKTGNILLGCTVSMLSFALLITMLVAAIEFGDMEKNVEKQLQIISEIEGVKEDPILRGHFAMSIIMGFMCLAKFLFDLVFVYGVCEEQPSMIKTYLIFWIVWTVLSLCIVFCTASYYDIIIIACEVFYFVTPEGAKLDTSTVTAAAFGVAGAYGMDFLGFVLLDLLILYAALGNAKPTNNNNYYNDWIPVIIAEKTTQASTSTNVEKVFEKAKTDSIWKPSESVYDFGETTDKVIKIITPEQFERRNGSTQYNFFEQDLLPDGKETTNAPVYINKLQVIDPKDYKTLKSFPYIQMNEKTNSSDIDFEFNTESLFRTSKQIRSHNFVNDIRNLYENVMKMKTTDARAFMSPDKEDKDNYYDVTEPTDEDDRNERNSRGYVYKQPIVVPVGLGTSRNEFSDKLQENLRKYNIKSNDMLNNYAISKSYVNNYDSMFQMYRTHVAPVIAIPFRYNRLNHLPVNPLLGVLLSNYGYYVQGASGLPNYYRNLYGFAANQIVNDRVTGSAPAQRSYSRTLYDTDADN